MKEENLVLKEKVSLLTKDLAKFVKGKENLDLILGAQKCSLDKGGLGYTKSNCEKYYKNFFVKASTSLNHVDICNYRGNKGHISSSCFMKKNNYDKKKYIYVQKGQSLLKFSIIIVKDLKRFGYLRKANVML